jgi:beta-lactamase regulating signal transducer with metallopeptidase domain
VDTLLQVGLSNAVAACVLAVVAAAVGYFCRRPAVRHALWLLVLLKLVTPPVYVPVPRPAEVAAPAVEAPPAEVALDPDPEVEAPPVPEGVLELAFADDPAERPEEPDATPPAVRAREAAGSPAVAWQPLVLTAWLGGSAVWLALAVLRARRFARLLRYARLAPASLQRDAAGLAARLGLAQAPVVRLLPGRVSPMLWAPGLGTWLLLPKALLDRLDLAGRRTLLAHELAHLRRRDHWVRLFELLVTALFWWHPVVWWARRELREAEEQCCDAWVLWALPQSAKTYALALVETVDFLSEARPALPALASGMGHVHDLRRRVTMIMQGTTPRALTWSGLLGLCGLGAFLLPVMPTWAQEEPAQPLRFIVGADKGDDAKVTQAEMQKLKALLEQKRAELAQLEAKLKAAQARMEKEGAGDKVKSRDTVKSGQIVIEIVDGDKRKVLTLPGGKNVLNLKGEIDAAMLEKIKKELAGRQGQIDAAVKKATEAAKKATEEATRERVRAIGALKIAAEADAKAKAGAKAEGRHRVIIEIINDGKRQVIELPPGSRVISGGDVIKAVPAKPGDPINIIRGVELKTVPFPKPGEKGAALEAGKLYLNLKKGEGDAADKRIQQLEKRLDELMRAVKELRGEMSKPKGGGQAPAEPEAAKLFFRFATPQTPANPPKK